MEILGPDLTRYRLRQALDLLGGVSKKENKEWEKLLASTPAPTGPAEARKTGAGR